MATKQLFVLRHAKSSWDDPSMPDQDRPLAPRGRRTVAILREHLESSAIQPALVLCSNARRARETLEGVNPTGDHLIEAELYDADAGELLDRLRRVADEVRSVMLIGHNPALQVLILRLTDDAGPAGEESDLDRVRRKFPTGGLATLEFEGEWRELATGAARLVGLVRPKQLVD
jgi:phosphohistidine phosphatase